MPRNRKVCQHCGTPIFGRFKNAKYCKPCSRKIADRQNHESHIRQALRKKSIKIKDVYRLE